MLKMSYVFAIMCYLLIMVWLKILLKVWSIAGSFEKKQFPKRCASFVYKCEQYLELQVAVF